MNKKGFFIIELLIALSIFVFFIMITSECITELVKKYRHMRQFEDLLDQAEHKMNTILAGQSLSVTENIIIKPYPGGGKLITCYLDEKRSLELIVSE